MTTPDEHLAVLLDYAKLCDGMVSAARSPDESRIIQKLKARAAAIRWIIAETAHGVDPSEVVT